MKYKRIKIQSDDMSKIAGKKKSPTCIIHITVPSVCYCGICRCRFCPPCLAVHNLIAGSHEALCEQVDMSRTPLTPGGSK